MKVDAKVLKQIGIETAVQYMVYENDHLSYTKDIPENLKQLRTSELMGSSLGFDKEDGYCLFDFEELMKSPFFEQWIFKYGEPFTNDFIERRRADNRKYGYEYHVFKVSYLIFTVHGTQDKYTFSLEFNRDEM